MRRVLFVLFVTALFVVAGIAVAFANGVNVEYGSPGNSCIQDGTGWKTDEESTAILNAGDIITSVWVKAGQNCVQVYPTDDSACYDIVVSGNTATVTKVGEERECKDISHLEGDFSRPTTTEPPPATTEPPPATTEPPPATTEPPPATTEPPPATTEPPPVTTEAPPTETETEVPPTGTPQPPSKGCDDSKRIWVWTLFDANGITYTLRDLHYDGTYDSPGKDQQCYYFGCDFVAVKAWGKWVSECDSGYDYWRTLPKGAGGGKCPLPNGPSN